MSEAPTREEAWPQGGAWRDGAWRRLRGAPDPGAVLCRLLDVPEGASALVDRSKGRDFPILIVRRKGALRAYVNACPHNGLPLTYRSCRVLSADGERLLCSNHGAAFRSSDGEPAAGTPEGWRLDPIPLSVGPDGTVSIATDEV